MRTIFVGMDVSKDDFKAAVKDDQNNMIGPVKTYKHDKNGLKAFDEYIQEIRKQLRCAVSFGMESTGIYHLSACQHLVEAGEDVKVFNTLELKRFKNRIRKTKTDSLDAQAIAEALLLNREPSYHPIKEPKLIHIRELCRLRARLVKKISLCKNQAVRNMDVLCRGYVENFDDVFCPSSMAIIKAAVRMSRLFETDIEKLTEILSKYMPGPAAEKKAKKISALFKNTVVPEQMRDTSILEIHMLIEQYEILEKQAERVERKIEKGIQKIDTHLLSIPGIGLLTAGAILGELGDISRFTSSDQLTAFAGLDPSIMESGRSRRNGHISKRGSPMLREALYNAALPAMRYNPVCRQLYQRLREKGKHHKICMVAVARKLLHIAYSVERNQRDFYVPAYITEPQPKTA